MDRDRRRVVAGSSSPTAPPSETMLIGPREPVDDCAVSFRLEIGQHSAGRLENHDGVMSG